jgi:hypothetical protein
MNFNGIYLKEQGTWSSLVYGARLENEYFKKSREFKSHSARLNSSNFKLK